MKIGLTLLWLLIAFAFSGCTRSHTKSFDQNVAFAESTRTPPTLNDERTVLMNEAGWAIPLYQRKSGNRYSSRAKTSSGESRKIIVATFGVKERVVADIPPHSVNHYEWLATKVTEFAGSDGRIFCYYITANPFFKEFNGNGMSGSIMVYRVCDQDGDGKFETKSGIHNSLIVPAWVK